MEVHPQVACLAILVAVDSGARGINLAFLNELVPYLAPLLYNLQTPF